MCKHLITSIVFILLIISTHHLCAQQKYEKESRLKEKNIPLKARDFIGSLSVTGSIRWYLEEGLDRKSIEAKFKLNGQSADIKEFYLKISNEYLNSLQNGDYDIEIRQVFGQV